MKRVAVQREPDLDAVPPAAAAGWRPTIRKPTASPLDYICAVFFALTRRLSSQRPTARNGDRPPPASADRLLLPDKAALAERLIGVFAHRRLEQVGGRKAAVALVIGEDHGSIGFLLTERAADLAAHAGQFALPGGRVEDGEDVTDAALRELREELGIVLTRAQVVGRLPDYRTGSGYCIAPIVLWADDVSDVRLNPAEVANAFHIPLRALLGPAVPTLMRVPGAERPIIQLPLGGDRLIHAPTGAILFQFAQAVLCGQYVDAQAFDEPVWART